MNHYSYIISSIVALTASTAVFADTSVVTNTISVSSHTGGNMSSGGTVTESEASSSITVTTMINGQIVEDVDVTSETPLSYMRATTTPNARVETHLVLTDTVPTLKAPHRDPVITEAPLRSTSTPSVAMPTTIIQSINTSVDEDMSKRDPVPHTQSLFVRITHSIRRAFTYVISHFFS